MTKFDDNLWREVEGKYGPELSEAAGPLHPHSRLRVPVIAGTSLGLVGGSAAAVIVLTAASSSPAFAVTPHRDGTVSVVIRRIEGIPGANQRLAQLGIRARTVQVAGGCQVPAARALALVTAITLARDGHKQWVDASPGAIHARIRPAEIPRGRTLVIPAIRMGARVQLVRGRAVPGVIPACLPPAVAIQTTATGTRVHVVACRDVILPPARLVVPGPATNGTSTNGTSTNGTSTNGTSTSAAPPQTTVTQTIVSPATTTDSSTNTVATTTTDAGTGTAGGSTTDSGTTPQAAPVGPGSVRLRPALWRACRFAAGAATRSAR